MVEKINLASLLEAAAAPGSAQNSRTGSPEMV